MLDRINPVHSAPEQETVARLHAYLETIGFHAIYKNLTGVRSYYIDASAFRAESKPVKGLARIGKGGPHSHSLLFPLTAHQPVSAQSLGVAERDLASRLASAGILREQNGTFHPTSIQLISCYNFYLLIDARINFRGQEMHELYIGPDSLMLLYYLDTLRVAESQRVLDLCTGSGIVGIYAALRGASVHSTDLSPFALTVAFLNRCLNQLEDKIKIKQEDMGDTLLDSASKYDLICCNPPFVASPSGYESAIYAHGPGNDGQGFLRLLFEEGPSRLTSGGTLAVVADLPGNYSEPHFLESLDTAATKNGLGIDVFIDNVVAASANAKALISFLKHQNPDRDPERIESDVNYCYQNDLRADRFFLTTMIARRSDTSHVRVFNRFKRDRFYGTIPV